MGRISVTKCHGTGNDFIILDARGVRELAFPALARTLCERRFSVGADGLLVLCDPHKSDADVSMRIFNADGSEAEMCGNGIRCIARYLNEENPERIEASVETPSGVVETKIVRWNGAPGAAVAMGEPRFIGGLPGKLGRSVTLGGESAPVYAVSMGNPHVVVFATSDVANADLAGLAATVGTWKVFDSEPNVEVANVTMDGIRMRVHERGVGETMACGSGACAAAAVAIAANCAASPVVVTSAGGSVSVAWQGPDHPAVLTGDAELVFRTSVEYKDS